MCLPTSLTHRRNFSIELLPILQQRLLNLMSGDNGNVERMDIERINKRSAELSDAITTLAPQKKREQAEQYIISWEMCAFDRQGNERIKVLLDGIAKCKAAGDTKTAKDFQKVADVHAAKVSTLKKLAFQASHEACSGRE